MGFSASSAVEALKGPGGGGFESWEMVRGASVDLMLLAAAGLWLPVMLETVHGSKSVTKARLVSLTLTTGGNLSSTTLGGLVGLILVFAAQYSALARTMGWKKCRSTIREEAFYPWVERVQHR